MPRYRYIAKDMDGRIYRGTMEASDSLTLAEHLRQKGLYCCRWRTAGEKKELFGPLGIKRISPLCRQLGSMMAAGVSLGDILTVSIASAKDRRVRSAFKRLYREIYEGRTLSEAMERMGSCFPKLLIHMVRMGEASGTLDEILERMAVYYTHEEELEGKIRAAMTYPVILLAVTVCSCVFLLTEVLPGFASMLPDQELPALTRLMLAAGNGIQARWKLYAVVLFLLPVLFAGALRAESIRIPVHRMLLSLPFAGHLMKIIYTSRFASAFSVLYGSGTGILEALDVTGRIIGNDFIRLGLKEACGCLEQGQSLSAALGRLGIFPPVFLSMTVAGEESGNLERIMEQTGIYYEKEGERAINQMIALLEPALILLMAGIVGSIVMAVMLPVFRMYSSML